MQTLLGHSELEMTELYLNDRGLSRHEWKRVAVASASEHTEREAPHVD